MKQCNNCKQDKSLDSFYTVNKRNKPTIYHICKDCCSSQKLDMKSYYRDWELKKKYGISIDTYKEESEKRENKCDICSKQVESLHVDHNHITGKIRGYLCGSCNRALGLFQDDPEIITKATQYLYHHEAPSTARCAGQTGN